MYTLHSSSTRRYAVDLPHRPQDAVATPNVAPAQEPSALVQPRASNVQQGVLQQQTLGTAPMEIVDNVQRCREVVELLANDHPLALDCEGRLWGMVDVCLVQIAAKSGKCFLFDVRQGGAALFTGGGLRRLLEDVNVLKVGHDLRSDASALYVQYNVFLNHIFDTQGEPWRPDG